MQLASQLQIIVLIVPHHQQEILVINVTAIQDSTILEMLIVFSAPFLVKPVSAHLLNVFSVPLRIEIFLLCALAFQGTLKTGSLPAEVIFSSSYHTYILYSTFLLLIRMSVFLSRVCWKSFKLSKMC